jgi:hypothetical protein
MLIEHVQIDKRKEARGIIEETPRRKAAPYRSVLSIPTFLI